MVMRVSTCTAIVAAAALTSGCGGSVNDPANAACPNPPTSIGRLHVEQDHREATIHFTCSGSRLAGTLYLPLTNGRHPAAVWLHGSGEQPRLPYGDLVIPYIRDGMAYLLLRQARGRRVSGEVLSGRLWSLQPGDRRRGRRGRRRPASAGNRPQPGRLPRCQRSGLGRAACGRGVEARRVPGDR
jgi:hypothetical protein